MTLNSAALSTSLGIDADVLDDIRTVGVVVSDEMPRLVDDFYGWLAELPEFERFFQDKVLLAHVKAQQVRYWQDFLAAQIDDEYVNPHYGSYEACDAVNKIYRRVR